MPTSITLAQIESELFTCDFKGAEHKRALFTAYVVERDAAKDAEIASLRAGLANAARIIEAGEKDHRATRVALAIEVGRSEYYAEAIRAASEDSVGIAFKVLEAALSAVPPRSSNPAACNREALGRLVREIWIEWAKEQTHPKPSWLLSWEEISESDREVDRRIGERLAMLPVSTFHGFFRFIRSSDALAMACTIIEEEAESLFRTNTVKSVWQDEDESVRLEYVEMVKTAAALRNLL